MVDFIKQPHYLWQEHYLSFLDNSYFIMATILLVILMALGFFMIFGIKRSLSNRSIATDSKDCPASRGPKHTSHRATSDKCQYNLRPRPTQAFKLPPLRPTTSTLMTMGLRRLDHANWLTIDDDYMTFHRIRNRLLANYKSSVASSLPPSLAACQEVLSLVSEFLATRYPKDFEIYTKGSCPFIFNRQTGESFPLSSNLSPLETAARLAMEDFNILIKDDEGIWRLQASATLFPAGWKLEERIGGTLDNLHGPVPKWSEKLGPPVSRYVAFTFIMRTLYYLQELIS